MRLSVSIVDTLSTQLVIDLQKIYANYLPQELLTEQSIADEFSSSSFRLYVTMFNERHIGAVKVEKNVYLLMLVFEKNLNYYNEA